MLLGRSATQELIFGNRSCKVFNRVPNPTLADDVLDLDPLNVILWCASVAAFERIAVTVTAVHANDAKRTTPIVCCYDVVLLEDADLDHFIKLSEFLDK